MSLLSIWRWGWAKESDGSHWISFPWSTDVPRVLCELPHGREMWGSKTVEPQKYWFLWITKIQPFSFVVVVIIKTFLASIPVLNHLETEEKGRISDTNPIFIYNFDIVFVMYVLYSFLFLKHVWLKHYVSWLITEILEPIQFCTKGEYMTERLLSWPSGHSVMTLVCESSLPPK